jgi:hypothetical protein
MSNYNSARYVVIMLAATLTLAYAAVADFSGKWSGSAPDNAGGMYVVLQQEGTLLTGSAGPTESKQFPIMAGKVGGDHLTFEIKMGGGIIRFDLIGTTSELRGIARILEDDGNTDTAKVVLERVP